MKIISCIHEMQQSALALKREARRIAFVPTMGFLHEGHASLLREGRQRGDVLVLSIFVNPIQFGPSEDLERYPRNLEGDCAIARECGVDIVFTPTAAEMYPAGFQTSIRVHDLALPLCGASRPGHFDGVATVVTKLFNIVQPDVALFGSQGFPAAGGHPPHGHRSDPAGGDRRHADRPRGGRPGHEFPQRLPVTAGTPQRPLPVPAVRLVRERYAAGEHDADNLLAAAQELIAAEPAATVDYLELRDAATLETVQTASDTTLLALAVKIGTTRLIDNTLLGDGPQAAP